MESLRHIARLLSIARTLARHDALFILERLQLAPAVVTLAKLVSRRRVEGRPGERLARAFQEMGPSFIKVGQMLSTRSDLLGEEMAADLSHLQDQLPPFPGKEARAAIEAEFGRPLEELFRHFEDEPVAAASIAQVHFAVTVTGEDVAVKVLRPNIENAFKGDVDLLMWGAAILERTRPEWRRLKPVESVQTLARSVEMEMDLRFEAAAAAEMRENFEDHPDVFIPRIDWLRTGQRVLTTERVHGISLRDVDAIKRAGHDPQEILRKTAEAFFYQGFRDGFFHGDMHPGNLFVMDDGAIAIVDFGIMGRLDKATRRHLAELLTSFLTRNYRRAAEVHFEAGWIPANQPLDEFTQACRSIAEPILDKPQNEISIARLLGQLFQITETFHMETQPQLLLLQKTMLVAEGTGRNLAPEANMWFIARPLIEEWMRVNLGPEALVRDAVQQGWEALHRLPGVIRGLENALSQFDEQGLRLHPDTVAGLRRRRARDSAALPIAALVLAIAALAVAAL
ncbi:MAG: 2-polyprenylphenol 6-hydroxylase [Alphaproteobacteria bacterium]|nr:2-polyprenylphenol 6-hydroxylase [Alphaproteobacteria bacterium]